LTDLALTDSTWENEAALLSSFWNGPLYFAVLGFLCGVVGFRFGWRSGLRPVLPLVQGLLGWVAFFAAWRVAGPGTAALAVGGWALGLTVVALWVFHGARDLVDRRVLGAARYRREMLAWLTSGKGFAARPVATARAHAVELAAYLIAAVSTANFLSIVIGAVLLNKMNAWVASLLEAARRPWTVRLLAWNLWSVVRVAAYVVLGSACAAPLAARAGLAAPRPDVELLAWVGGAGVVADLALKLLLSGPCGRALASAIDPGVVNGTPDAEE
jgi:hypothetical protein